MKKNLKFIELHGRVSFDNLKSFQKSLSRKLKPTSYKRKEVICAQNSLAYKAELRPLKQSYLTIREDNGRIGF